MPSTKTKRTLKRVEVDLENLLEDGHYYTLEDLSKKLEVKPGIIHRAFLKLNERLGWSIRPSNKVPYARWMMNGHRNLRRGRQKGERYEHDWAEPAWERTRYYVRRSS